jgi:hypothetical protein
MKQKYHKKYLFVENKYLFLIIFEWRRVVSIITEEGIKNDSVSYQKNMQLLITKNDFLLFLHEMLKTHQNFEHLNQKHEQHNKNIASLLTWFKIYLFLNHKIHCNNCNFGYWMNRRSMANTHGISIWILVLKCVSHYIREIISKNMIFQCFCNEFSIFMSFLTNY